MEISANLFSRDDLSKVVQKLCQIEKELDQLLSEYQTNTRRSEIEELKSLCQPGCLLLGVQACLTDEAGVIETAEDLTGIPLEQEFFKCETIDWKIDSWSGIKNPNQYADKPHPWLSDPALSKYPRDLAACYDSVMSSYFSVFEIQPDLFYGAGKLGDRRLAWDFWSKRIFNSSSPQLYDENRWQQMQRAYFNSEPKRREFLNNLLAAIRNPSGSAADTTTIQDAQNNDASMHGFVYFIRNGDLCKIGITENLLRRLGELQPDEILNVIRCKNYQDVERKIHSAFKEIRLPQTEYFRMNAAQIDEAHRLLTLLADI